MYNAEVMDMNLFQHILVWIKVVRNRISNRILNKLIILSI